MATTEQPAVPMETGGAQGEVNEKSAQIRQLVEFYFGDSNFRRDTFMKAEAGRSVEGFINIAVLLTFNKLKKLTTKVEDVAAAFQEESDVVELNAEKTMLRRKHPLPEEDTAPKRTLYVSGMTGLATPITVDQVIVLFSRYGMVTYVRLLRDKVTKEVTGSGMVEFKNEEDKNKALEQAPTDTFEIEGTVIKLKVKPFVAQNQRKRKAPDAPDADEKDGEKGVEKGVEGEGVEEVVEDAVQADSAGKSDEPPKKPQPIPEEKIAEEAERVRKRYLRLTGIPNLATFKGLRECLDEAIGKTKYVSMHRGVALVKFVEEESVVKALAEDLKPVTYLNATLKIDKPSDKELRQQVKNKLEYLQWKETWKDGVKPEGGFPGAPIRGGGRGGRGHSDFRGGRGGGGRGGGGRGGGGRGGGGRGRGKGGGGGRGNKRGRHN